MSDSARLREIVQAKLANTSFRGEGYDQGYMDALIWIVDEIDQLAVAT